MTFIGVSDGQQQEEVHHKVTCSTARRDARLFSLLGSFIAAHGNVPRKIRAADHSKHDRCLSSDSECCVRSKSDQRRGVNRAAASDAVQHIATPSCWDEERCGGQSNLFVSQESSHTSQLSQILPQPDVEMGTTSVPVSESEDAMEVNALCEKTVDPPDMEAFFDAAGECYDHYTGESLDRDATIVGIRAELTQMQEFGKFEWKRKSEKPPNDKSHKHEDVSQSQRR